MGPKSPSPDPAGRDESGGAIGTRQADRPTWRKAWDRLRGGELTPARAALSVGLGLMVGVTPLWGVHWLILGALALPLRLDLPVSLLASQISLPPLAPFLVGAELGIGHALRTGQLEPPRLPSASSTIAVTGELVLGTLVLALVMGSVGALLAYVFTVSWQRSRAIRPPASP